MEGEASACPLQTPGGTLLAPGVTHSTLQTVPFILQKWQRQERVFLGASM